MAKIEAIIYDYDGLIADTEDVWFQSCRAVCEPYDVEITEEHRFDLMRSHLSAYLVERFQLPITPDKLRPILYGEFESRLEDGIPVMPGAVESINLFGEHFPLAVGSGSKTAQVDEGLTRIGVRDDFEAVVGSDMVTSGKPSPDTYLKVAEILDVNPRHCVVFEDQPKGIRAAKAAGMLCVSVPNALIPGVDYSEADKIISTMAEASLDLLATIKVA